MKRKPILPIIIVFAVLVAVALYFEINKRSRLKSEYLEGSGTIEVTEIAISTKVAGKIVSLPFEEGDTVKKNDLLVRIEYDELSAQKNSALANLENATKNLKRIRELFASGSVSQKDLDAAETAYRVAKANLDLVTASIDNAIVYSPISGTVLSRNLEIGEMAFPGTAILTVGDVTTPWIRVYVSAVDLKYVSIGRKAFVMVDAYPGEKFFGKVVSISSKAEFTPKTIQTKDERVKLMYAVKIRLHNPDGKLKAGMPADVYIYKNDK
ncbi:MAG: efflux RND transporter periplasmic adaptor subunit [Spirochaetes bacterium]|nr:efflux RND transporter periplasmic adaptor subunit [Spirochaetota bacterium]